jgi:hypothetical protein
MADTSAKATNKPAAGTAAVVRREPDEERRRTKHGLGRERAPRPRSFGTGLPSFSLVVGRDATALDVAEEGDAEAADAPAVHAEPPTAASLAPTSAAAPIASPIVAAALPAPPAPTAVSEPGDRLEREADDAAERVVRRLAVSPGGAPTAPPGPPEPPPAYAHGPVVQRASLVEVVAQSAGLTPRTESTGGLIVDDRTETLTPGQMKKTPFLERLRAVACETAERELRRSGRTAQGCPYIDQVLGRFARRSPEQLERALRRYAPETRTATRAADYLPPLATQLGRGIATWASTGRMPDNLPDELRPGRLSAVLEAGASLGRAARALFKGRDGGAGRPGVDGGALAGQLGAGRPLDGSARSRMESAFGHPFGDVRIHVDDRAAALSRELEARAFTVGTHVAFGAGEFRPGTPAGDALLAHELAHVVQQRGADPAPERAAEPSVDGASLDHERDADDAAEAAVIALHAPTRRRRRAAPRRSVGRLRLQRCGSRPPPRSAADLDRELPVARTIRERYGVGVTEESSRWSADELERVSEAMALLSEAERAQVAGITFVRVAETGATGGGLDAHAVHHLEISTQGNQVRRVREIRVSDAVSQSDAAGLRSLIVHELGHVIESARDMEARYRLMVSATEIDPARVRLNAAHLPFADAFNAAHSRPQGYSNADYRAARPFVDGIDAAVQAYQALRALANDPQIANVMRDHAARNQALTTALAARDAAWTQLQASAPGNPAITDYRPVIPLMDTAVAELRAYVAARVRNQDAGTAHDATVTRRGGQEVSRRLDAFASIIDANQIGPLSWPGVRAESYTARVLRVEGRARFYVEMFAEAFSMWRIDRQALQDQAPALVTFFDNGGHLR